ncbi:hybrid signal transduction histidine kinase A-like isoform X2 [Gordionus sp. m RMFG-2023]|uniref:hybrid signal transduction histidine kinase A-like isoform X2 n=2 Tax=Gordionus sp. m RMFG-2023 TaxID=3053472 RepID=UPI0031FDEB3A
MEMESLDHIENDENDNEKRNQNSKGPRNFIINNNPTGNLNLANNTGNGMLFKVMPSSVFSNPNISNINSFLQNNSVNLNTMNTPPNIMSRNVHSNNALNMNSNAHLAMLKNPNITPGNVLNSYRMPLSGGQMIQNSSNLRFVNLQNLNNSNNLARIQSGGSARYLVAAGNIPRQLSSASNLINILSSSLPISGTTTNSTKTAARQNLFVVRSNAGTGINVAGSAMLKSVVVDPFLNATAATRFKGMNDPSPSANFVSGPSGNRMMTFNNRAMTFNNQMSTGGGNGGQKYTEVFARFLKNQGMGNALNESRGDIRATPMKIMSEYNQNTSRTGDSTMDREISDSEANDNFDSSLNDDNGERVGESGLPPTKGNRKRKKITAYTLWCANQRKGLQPGLDFGQISRILGEAWTKLAHKEKMSWKRRAKKMTEKLIAEYGEDIRSGSKSYKKRINKNNKRYSSMEFPIDNDPDYNFKMNGTDVIDSAAYLKLLGECLSNLGDRLMMHVGQIAVQGSLSVLLDSLICALGPLMCLTSQLPLQPIDEMEIPTEKGNKPDDNSLSNEGIDALNQKFEDDKKGNKQTTLVPVVKNIFDEKQRFIFSKILDNIAFIMPGL